MRTALEFVGFGVGSFVLPSPACAGCTSRIAVCPVLLMADNLSGSGPGRVIWQGWLPLANTCLGYKAKPVLCLAAIYLPFYGRCSALSVFGLSDRLATQSLETSRLSRLGWGT